MSLEESISAVEQLLDKVSAALLAADPQAVQVHSTALRDAAGALAQSVEQASGRGQPPLPLPLKNRIDAIARQLAVQREAIARLAVVTDRQVAGLVPQADPASTTYGNGLGSRTAQPGVARIYRSAG
ncbi:hypothetical protein [Acidovorax sp. BL-A-41-H1]|uniref:hypothetical protein n=1 Tax=Acidovorax sp. BL-A-41-H1 TaxID=3421102 RepID=UPI003F7A96A4